MTDNAGPSHGNVPELYEARKMAMEDALNHSFQDGRIKVEDRDESNFFGVLHPEVQFAALAAREYVDEGGAFSGDERLKLESTAALEGVSEQFQPTGVVGAGDMNTPYFTLVPFTRAMLSLKDHVDAGWFRKMIDRCVKLFADAATNINRTHDYLNPRGLEAVSALGLYRLTGVKPYLDRCTECLDELLTRLYLCGAQPYHTGIWIWGRRPAQAYQFLTASLMLYLGFELDRQDAVDYVRRIMDYSLIATNRHGISFITLFEGLHKVRSYACASRQWTIATALGDQRFASLGRTTYEIWTTHALDFGEQFDVKRNVTARKTGYMVALNDALHLGISKVPEAEPFVPERGRHVLEDISTVFIHETERDVGVTVLTGYSAFVEADWGSIKLFALTPELTETPTYRNAGTDALRTDWKTPTEQIICTERDGKVILKGRVFTKWGTDAGKDFSRLHNRLLEVTMTYTDGELLLEYETINNTQPEPIASRLLFLLVARPTSESPRLRIGDDVDTVAPPADSSEEFKVESPIGTVRFTAPDGSGIEIVPEVSTAQSVIAERPGSQAVPMKKSGIDKRHKFVAVRCANEGSLRLAFEGPDTLNKGRYRIRFLLSE